ncbi:MAG: RNA methyltransferase [Gammaproteobacteria bacterium]|nr:RNA methyltransferase [Gammaproteobacteria bacterium]
MNFKDMEPEKKEKIVDYLSGFINEQRQALLKEVLAQRTRHLTVVLEDIYQSQNASAVLRTCECLGIQECHVIENDHEYQLNPAVVQGAAKWIELYRYNEQANNSETCLEKLKDRGYNIVAMTLSEHAIPLSELEVNSKLALCFGSEEPGLSDEIYELSDLKVRIPMHGFTQSFNLSVSAGITLYLLRQKLVASDIPWQLDDAEKESLYIEWLAQSTPSGEALLNKILREYE